LPKALKLELEDFSLGLEASIENIRLGQKFELETNALAYFPMGSIAKKRHFTILNSEQKRGKVGDRKFKRYFSKEKKQWKKDPMLQNLLMCNLWYWVWFM